MRSPEAWPRHHGRQLQAQSDRRLVWRKEPATIEKPAGCGFTAWRTRPGGVKRRRRACTVQMYRPPLLRPYDYLPRSWRRFREPSTSSCLAASPAGSLLEAGYSSGLAGVSGENPPVCRIQRLMEYGLFRDDPEVEGSWRRTGPGTSAGTEPVETAAAAGRQDTGKGATGATCW